MNKNKIIFIKDTLCGWCRISSPEMDKIFDYASKHKIEFDFYHKRLFTGEYIPSMTSDFVKMVEHVGTKKGKEITGMTFSKEYFDLIKSEEFTHNSDLTSIGDAAAKLLTHDKETAFKYSKKLQDLIFDKGENPNDINTIKSAAEGFFEPKEFEIQLNKEETRKFAYNEANYAETLSSKSMAQGVPALFFYDGEQDRYIRLDPYNSNGTINIIQKLNR